MFDSLSEKLQDVIRQASGNATLTEDNMQEAIREIRRALLNADVKECKAFGAIDKNRL